MPRRADARSGVSLRSRLRSPVKARSAFSSTPPTRALPRSNRACFGLRSLCLPKTCARLGRMLAPRDTCSRDACRARKRLVDGRLCVVLGWSNVARNCVIIWYSMFVKRFFEPSIAQASYLIGCQQVDEAIVIDANRDVEQYIEAAAQEGLRITHVTETHIHADYVSGSRELAQRTGASLCLSDEGDRDWKYQFEHSRKLKHGDRITIGNIRLDVLHTPGHTPEHLTFLITDGAAADKPIAAVTGDFVFVGDVGRPDLLEKAANIKGTMEAGARVLYASLQAFAKHEDWLQIWPGHGAGSACGKGISAIPSSTLGYEKRFNWAFNKKSEAEFVDAVLTGQPEPPKYFAKMKRVNKEGPAILGALHIPPKLDAAQLPELIARKALVIDTRPATEYAAGHLQGTINVPFNSSFVTWAGWLVQTDDFYLIADSATASARLEELSRSLALIGIDCITGYFDASAAMARATIAQVTPKE